MNPELKQRLIGAAVVTALATIFIPMMFDDPVDNKGQTVSELKIPETPVKSTEQSANKLPTPATNKTATPSTNPEEEAADTELEETETEANAEPPINETTPTQGSSETVAEAVEQPVAEEEPEPLDTGVVPEAKTPVKKPTAKPKTTEPEVVVEEIKVNKPVVKKIEKTPVETPAATKPVLKKPEAVPTPNKPTPTTPANATEKTKNPELVRWTIHAGSFSQKDNATALMKTLREQHIPVVMETIPSAKGAMYRLKIGPELDKKKAAANKAKLDKQGIGNVMFSE